MAPDLCLRHSFCSQNCFRDTWPIHRQTHKVWAILHVAICVGLLHQFSVVEQESIKQIDSRNEKQKQLTIDRNDADISIANQSLSRGYFNIVFINFT